MKNEELFSGRSLRRSAATLKSCGLRCSIGRKFNIQDSELWNSNKKFEQKNEIKLGKAEKIIKGKDITIIGIGKTVSKAIKISEILKDKYKIEAEVINARFLKPLDKETILESIKKTGK